MYLLLLWTQISQTNADRTKISVNLRSHLPHCLWQRAMRVRVPMLKIKNPSHLKGERDIFPRGTTLVRQRMTLTLALSLQGRGKSPLPHLARCNGLARIDLLDFGRSTPERRSASCSDEGFQPVTLDLYRRTTPTPLVHRRCGDIVALVGGCVNSDRSPGCASGFCARPLAVETA